MKNCIAALNSLTLAMKAQDALTSGAVFSKIVKLDSDMTRKGCAYGLKIDCGQLDAAKAIFAERRIKIREYAEEGNRPT